MIVGPPDFIAIVNIRKELLLDSVLSRSTSAEYDGSSVLSLHSIVYQTNLSENQTATRKLCYA